jgi:uncharacterized protein YcbX
MNAVANTSDRRCPRSYDALVTTVGRIQHIARYPVKSMRGELLDEAEVALHGIPGDRTYTFVRAQDDLRTLWPFLTGRDCPELMRYQPVGRTVTAGPRFRGHTRGRPIPVGSAELLADLERHVGQPLRLHADIAATRTWPTCRWSRCPRCGPSPTPPGFRGPPPLAHEPGARCGRRAIREKEWVERTLSVGGARLVVTEQDRRCVMTTLDPETGESTPAVLKKAGNMNDAFVGVYASVAVAGKVAVGDEVRVD